MNYYSVESRVSFEFTEQKSRFIGIAFPVTSEEEAKKELSAIRKEHPFATHVCYAFIADRAGNLMRFSDDGEPQGTAGVPILEVLKSKNLKESAVAVVRYFGGIKLGAGGLVRAYAKASAGVLEQSRIAENAEGAFLSVTFSYDAVDVFRRYAEKEGFTPTYGYDESVTARFVVRKEKEGEVRAQLTDLLLGKCTTVTEKTEYYRF